MVSIIFSYEVSPPDAIAANDIIDFMSTKGLAFAAIQQDSRATTLKFWKSSESQIKKRKADIDQQEAIKEQLRPEKSNKINHHKL